MNEAELLFTHILGCDRASLYQDGKRRLAEGDARSILAVFKRRIKGEPLQYILGECEFMGLDLKVSPSVLIPRPETEILAEAAYKYIRQKWPNADNLNILDLGTGSGCIAVFLARHLGGADILASDISLEAIRVAKYNAILNRVKERVRFLKSDLFSNIGLKDGPFDVIISNPPYVSRPDIEGLQDEVKREPRLALDGGVDGLDFYRRISIEAGRHLKADGALFLEAGFGQAESIGRIFNAEDFKISEVIRDYNGIERVLVFKR